ncbi:hypothetical protein [Nostoc sp.]|uniref:hypothetical protein n=1 Tax=Nostoc sp. TaxID=1180 RepID=UPI002FF5C4F9
MNVISVTKETSFADFVCQVLNICGKKEIVVIVAAANPRTVRKSMFNYLIKLQHYTSAIALACLIQRYMRHFTLLSDRYNSLTTILATY